MKEIQTSLGHKASLSSLSLPTPSLLFSHEGMENVWLSHFILVWMFRSTLLRCAELNMKRCSFWLPTARLSSLEVIAADCFLEINFGIVLWT